ncbi:MAG: glucose-1-phosphate adenylyltransferase [Gammaproteobacteria bacterium]
MTEADGSASCWRRRDALALVLAGGNGTRLHGLTARRAKPAVPFGGQYRTIDFTLSNCINSGIRRIAVLTQYKSQSLIRHVEQGFRFLRRELGEFVEIWPAQQRCGERWYSGTVDAVHQNRDLIEALDPEQVLVLAGDHVYAMDYSRMIDAHVESGAQITVGCVEVPLSEAHAFGIVGADGNGRVRSFVEKPEHPEPCRGDRDALASMGIYVFDRDTLFDRLDRDAADPDSVHDFGYSVLPEAIHDARVHAYLFRAPDGKTPGYWRDVGTVDAYWSAHMDLLAEAGPKLDLFDASWPIFTHVEPCAPARIGPGVRIGASIIGPGATVFGDVHRSVVSTRCEIGPHSLVKDSVLLPGVKVGRNCRLERVVVDSRCVIPDNTVLGGDLLADDGVHYVSPRGIVLVTRHASRADARAGAAVARKVA